jgi:hypothetical protein
MLSLSSPSLPYGRYGQHEEEMLTMNSIFIYVDDELVFAMRNLPRTCSGELRIVFQI